MNRTLNVPVASRSAAGHRHSTMATSQTILCPECQQPNPVGVQHCQHCGTTNMVLNDDAPTDDRRYYITRVIKKGGQGSVYEGIDQDGRIYAIKEMLDHFVDPKERDEATRRFNAEATILQKLRHPRIPRVYSHFTDEGRHYLTMDFVHGDDLEHVLEQQHGKGIPEHKVLEWAWQICDVLDYIHSNGMVYRDVKPSNIMIDHQDGGVKLVDFGIAKILNPTERGGTQIGTPGYAPPEQYQGLATPVSDIYALAATLHHLLTGRDPTDEPPFSFPPARHINPNVSQRTADALAKALEMKPEDRFQTIVELRAALRPLFGTHMQQVMVAPQTGGINPPAGSAPAQPARVQAAPPQPQPANPQRSSAPAAPAPKPRRGQTAPLPRAAPAPQKQQQPQAQQPPQPRRGGFGRLIRRAFWFTMLLVIVGGIAAGFVFAPDTIFQLVEGVMPQREEPEPVLGAPQQFPLEVEALVPVGADEGTIREALRNAYQQRLESEYPGAAINPNISISVVGGVDEVGQEGDQVRYRATMQGFVQLPQGP